MSAQTRIVLIAAIARNGVIGIDNRLPWHLPEDLRHFKELTTGHAVIMGRKTWESLPPKFRPLPGRTNIVVTRNHDYRAEGATVVHTIAAAQEAAEGDLAYVIGGAEVYAQALPFASRLEITEIDATFEGDAGFPARNPAEWREAARASHVSATSLPYAFVTYDRIS